MLRNLNLLVHAILQNTKNFIIRLIFLVVLIFSGIGYFANFGGSEIQEIVAKYAPLLLILTFNDLDSKLANIDKNLSDIEKNIDYAQVKSDLDNARSLLKQKMIELKYFPRKGSILYNRWVNQGSKFDEVTKYQDEIKRKIDEEYEYLKLFKNIINDINKIKISYKHNVKSKKFDLADKDAMAWTDRINRLRTIDTNFLAGRQAQFLYKKENIEYTQALRKKERKF